MKESTLERKVAQWAKKHGFETFRINTSGWPDRVFLYGGEMLFMEFKTTKGRLSKRQTARIKWLRENEYEVHVTNDYEEAIMLLGWGHRI